MSMKTIVFANPGGEALSADVYLPQSSTPTPIIIGVHGSAWRWQSAQLLPQYLAPWLAERGYAMFSIDYRLVRKDKNRYPAAVDDVRTAIRYVREHAAELNADTSRIVLLGDSSGAHLAALVGLTERPQVKAVVPIVGVYDLAAQWEHDLLIKPYDAMTPAFLGVELPENRALYFEASAISHAVTANVGPSFLVTWSFYDDIVDFKDS